jgi:hypothetical protein
MNMSPDFYCNVCDVFDLGPHEHGRVATDLSAAEVRAQAREWGATRRPSGLRLFSSHRLMLSYVRRRGPG